MKLLLAAIALVLLCAAWPVFGQNKKYPPREIVQFVVQFPAFEATCTVTPLKLVDAKCLVFFDEPNKVAYCALLDTTNLAFAIVVKKDGMEDFVLWKREELTI